jgi:ketosteroid isomerase-like protein
MSAARKTPAAQTARAALDAADISRVIEMAWEDRTSFDAIEQQFGLNEAARTQAQFFQDVA